MPACPGSSLRAWCVFGSSSRMWQKTASLPTCSWLEAFAQTLRDRSESCCMRTLNHLFEKNRAWAERIRRQDPEFFLKLSKQQVPRYMWIGCSDSRVPANEIVDL